MKKMFDLQIYRKEKEAIANDKRYSDLGKKDALSTFERRHKDNARKAVQSLRKEAVVNALKLRDAQAIRFEEFNNAMDNVDYGRLNYETQAIQSKIKAAKSITDVMDVWENAKRSNDAYALKAWKETSQGFVEEKFGDDYADLKGQLFDDIQQAKVEIAKVEISEDELKAREALKKIEAESNEINEVYGSGRSVINRVFDGIGFEDGKIKLNFDYEIHLLTEKPETPAEVAWRLARKREKDIEEYKKIMGSMADGLDYDFDDLSGVFGD